MSQFPHLLTLDLALFSGLCSLSSAELWDAGRAGEPCNPPLQAPFSEAALCGALNGPFRGAVLLTVTGGVTHSQLQVAGVQLAAFYCLPNELLLQILSCCLWCASLASVTCPLGTGWGTEGAAGDTFCLPWVALDESSCILHRVKHRGRTAQGAPGSQFFCHCSQKGGGIGYYWVCMSLVVLLIALKSCTNR